MVCNSLTEDERQESIKMLRVNHSGEVCAQALYQGQALMARSSTQYNNLMQAAAEETAHLSWCKQRLQQLNGKTSLLNPLWYAGAYAIGALAGMAGDKISLGFIAETEYQVTAHLEAHLSKLAPNDHKSRAILKKMRDEELQHATNAIESGGVKLPLPIKFLMRCAAKVLTTTAARI